MNIVSLTSALIVMTILVFLFIQNQSNQQFNQNFSVSNPSPTLTPTSAPQKLEPTAPKSYEEQIEASQFTYPNSTVINSSGHIIILESNDSPTIVTNWYKTKVSNLGLNTTSFIQTSTNGDILNKLIATDSKKEVSIEISKNNSDPKVRISLNVNS